MLFDLGWAGKALEKSIQSKGNRRCRDPVGLGVLGSTWIAREAGSEWSRRLGALRLEVGWE